MIYALALIPFLILNFILVHLVHTRLKELEQNSTRWKCVNLDDPLNHWHINLTGYAYPPMNIIVPAIPKAKWVDDSALPEPAVMQRLQRQFVDDNIVFYREYKKPNGETT